MCEVVRFDAGKPLRAFTVRKHRKNYRSKSVRGMTFKNSPIALTYREIRNFNVQSNICVGRFKNVLRQKKKVSVKLNNLITTTHKNIIF